MFSSHDLDFLWIFGLFDTSLINPINTVKTFRIMVLHTEEEDKKKKKAFQAFNNISVQWENSLLTHWLLFTTFGPPELVNCVKLVTE